MTQSLHALVIQLIAQEAGALPGTVGELAHAAFYAAVQAVDPVLSQQMHDAQNRSAFSLSPLYFSERAERDGYWQSPQDGRIHVSQGQEGWLRLGLLNDRLFALFMQHLLTSSRPTIRLGDLHFAISQVFGAPGSHPWVGYTTVDELRAQADTPDRWVLQFESPTAIRWGEADNGARRVEIFPQPRMAVAGLRTRWDRMTGESWGRAFEEWVERNVVVGRIWRWETQPFAFQKQRYVGGLGKLEYRLLDSRDTGNVAHLNRLLRFAFYTGIGYKTTHGLGQVRVL
ncbi:MAG: CRISPR-associated endoribonuclease Cas6 [Caldilineaceae bacterium]|nr:CRISPR-associated endoribonuclease Cas6 [Caldilineaceae bacterium]